jgi:hypothetical protein
LFYFKIHDTSNILYIITYYTWQYYHHIPPWPFIPPSGSCCCPPVAGDGNPLKLIGPKALAAAPGSWIGGIEPPPGISWTGDNGLGFCGIIGKPIICCTP